MPYVIVQHSAYGYAGDPQFSRGLETRLIKPVQQKQVENEGGVIFPDLVSAEDFCDNAMYPSNAGLTPAARGTFSDKKIDGLRIYQPVRQVIG